MRAKLCPVCQERLPDATPAPRRCPICGHDLSQPPPRQGWIVGERDLRLVARRQRMLLWFVAANLLMQLVIPVLPAAVPAAAGLLLIVIAIGV